MRSRDSDSGGLRTITGTVLNTGSIFAGTGFTVTKGAAGVYTLVFQGVRFVRTGAVSLHGVVGYAGLGTPTQPNQLPVSTWNSSGTATDTTFDFSVQVMPI